MTTKKRIVITGGGTGGHIYPALAVATALQSDSRTDDVLYIGKQKGLEETKAEHHDIAFAGIDFFGMPRRPWDVINGRFLRWVAQLYIATQHSKRLLKEFQPDTVFATGGYVSGPVLLAARELKIPFVVHEPDAHPGLVNRFLGKHSAHATGAFAQANQMIKARQFTCTGNPIRSGLGQMSQRDAFKTLGLNWPDNSKVLWVTGGSQGAWSINQAIAGAAPQLLEDGWCVIHQCGEKTYDKTHATLEAEGLASNGCYVLQPFFDDMAAVWGAATAVVCRAGSMTLSELFVAGLPAILVPYPYAAADHQTHNAKNVEATGAAMVLGDSDCSAQTFLKNLRELEKNKSSMAAASQALAQPHATQTIVEILLV